MLVKIFERYDLRPEVIVAFQSPSPLHKKQNTEIRIRRNSLGTTKTDAADAIRRTVVAAVGRAQGPRVVVPGATAKNALRSGVWSLRIATRRVLVIVPHRTNPPPTPTRCPFAC